MALHLKFERLIGLQPDIAVIQECADPGIDLARGRAQPFTGYEWSGFNPNKGLGVFTFGSLLHPVRDPSYTDEYALYLPVQIEGECRLNLLAAWVVPKAPPGATSDPRRSLAHYAAFLSHAPAVVAGDFNMLPQQMTRRPAGSGASVAGLLRDAGLEDVDALASELWPGRPLKRTHFHQRKPRRGFVNDYVFIPGSAASGEAGVRLAGFDVGDPHEWITWSDHAPLVVDLEIFR